MLPMPISPTQTDARSPVDDNLMDSIRINLDYLDQQVTGGAGTFIFNVNGKLVLARELPGAAWDTAVSYDPFTPLSCRAVLKKSGTSGKLKFDIRKLTRPKTPIIGIDHQFESSIQTIGRIAAAINTQSVQRSLSPINTQSITRVKSSINIESIISLGGIRWRVNLSGAALDSDYSVGNHIEISGANDTDNNGIFEILEVNQDGFPCVVYQNASGVAQLTAAGTVDLQLFSYNYSNPVDPDFSPGELVSFASHSDVANDDLQEIYDTNVSGNNILVYNSSGAPQGSAAGTATANRWIFAYPSAVSGVHFVVGDNALMAGHTGGVNNGQFRIVDINRAGNNIVVYNFGAGAAPQGSAAGTASSNIWVYDVSGDPDGDVAVDDMVSFVNTTNSLNSGTFAVRYVNLVATDIAVYNQSGVAQGSAVGEVWHTKKIIKFSSNQSAFYSAESYVELFGVVDTSTSGNFYNASKYRAPHRVLEVNRGGGANFNIVISPEVVFTTHPSQGSPAGYVMTEAKSIFISQPEIDPELTGINPDRVLRIHSNNFVAGTVTSDTPLLLYLTEIPLGDPQDLTVILS